jgi:hypothetical protein
VNEPELRGELARLLSRRERGITLNRLLAFLLCSACAYLLLLVAVLLFGLSLFGFHLALYLSLSLFPLFLLLGRGRETALPGIRRLDQNCQLEAYLFTSSEEHRTFMAEPVHRLLQQRVSQRVFRFRISRANLRLAAVFGGLFLLFQLTSYLTLYRLNAGLTPEAIRARLAERELVVAETEAGTSEQTLEATPPQPRPESPEAGEQGAGQVEGQQQGEAEGEGEEGEARGLRESGPETGPVPPEGSEKPQRVLVPVPPGTSASPTLTEQTVEGGMELATGPEHSEAGSGSTGRSFLESPLKEYAGVPQRIAAKGEREMAAAPGLSEELPGGELPALFDDFRAGIGAELDFDALLERIRQRYLELLHERF